MQLAGPLSEGRPQTFVLRRDKEEIIKVLTPEKREDNGVYWFGLIPELKRQVAEIDEQSEAYQKGLRKGQYVFYFQPDEEEWVEKPGAANSQLVWKHGELKYSEKWDAKPEEFKTMALAVPPAESAGYGFTQERQAVELIQYVGGWGGLGDALAVAWGDTLRYAGGVFIVLRGLFNHTVDTSALAGPIGIGHFVFKVASTQTPMIFLWFLGYLSVTLGVLQFLPIPLLDGWHLLLVLVEKLKGRPVTPRLQEAFQYVGLFIIGALFLLATYNDIFRHLFLR